MKFLSIFLVFVFVFSSSTFAQEKKNPLAGTTWELTSGKWSSEDTTLVYPNTPYDRTIMIYGKTHWTHVRQDTSRKVSSSSSGTYSVDGDNLTVTLEMSRSYGDIGKSVDYKFQIEGNQQIIEAKSIRYNGHDWKSDQVWKRID